MTGIFLDSDRAVIAARTSGDQESLFADHVVLALPPRLIEATIDFAPAIPQETSLRWRDTPIWMAPHAKFVALYDRPFWREAGLSGTAQSMIGPMTEVHDATAASGAAALLGFLGVGPEQRAAVGRDRLKQACLNQLSRLFGPDAAKATATLLTDWTAEAFTATARDRHVGAHPLRHDGPWITGRWTDRICLAGSETSAIAPGYLAGALDAAQRAVRETFERLSHSGAI